jgi:hypothetical protein
VACGAIAQPAADVIARHDWPVDVHPLPPLLHNRPQRIPDEVRALATTLAGDYAAVAVGYADCGTYGALDTVCDELGLGRLPGLHCYDLYDGEEALAARLEAEPGTYLLTDFLVRSFDRTVVRELGLDRWPELRTLAQRAADRLGLPLTVVPTGTGRLERALADLLAALLPEPSAPTA